MNKPLKHIIITIIIILLLPIIAFVGLVIYGKCADAYAMHILKKAAPDVVYKDCQSYENEDGTAYDALYFQFTELNEEYLKDWEIEETAYYTFRVKEVNTGIFLYRIIINPTAQCATIEAHFLP